MGSVEDQVRARLQEWLVGAGVHEGEVALEVLYWLPSEFLDAYRELFSRSLTLGDEKSSGVLDAGMAKAVVSAQLRTGARQRVVEGRGAQSKAGGRYYRGEWIVKDDRWLEVKARVDRRLKGLVQAMVRKVMMEEGVAEGAEGKVMGESQGSRGGHGSRGGSRDSGEGGELVPMRGSKDGKKVCGRCGRLAGREWVRCPFPHL